MIIHSIVKKGLLGIAAVGAVWGASVPTVHAVVHGAGLGRAVFASDASCFNLLHNGVVNVCSTARTFEVPLPVHNSGVKNVVITGNSATCQAHGRNSGTTASTSGTAVTLVAGSTPDTKTSVGVNLPAGGRIFLTCSIASGGSVLNVDTSPN